jgi:gamma-glutamylcyclotransferase (GGCT)/AIG2-like uncharacterized protein YtfP
MFYFAYGINTNQDSMRYRCPGAISMGAATLLDHEFRFARHADVVPADSSVDGVLWLIDTDHLALLDHLEGYPYYYDRDILPVQYQGNIVMAECYRMQPDNPDDYPSQEYLNMLSEGYKEHGVPRDQIEVALDNVAKKQQNFVAKIPQKSSSFLKKYGVKR